MMKMDPVVEKALAVVAASRALRERALQRRRETLGRIDISAKPQCLLRPGTQMQLPLN